MPHRIISWQGGAMNIIIKSTSVKFPALTVFPPWRCRIRVILAGNQIQHGGHSDKKE